MTTTFPELLDAIHAYNHEADQDLLQQTYEFASHAHARQKRATGEPYVIHPVEVARILANYRVDTETIIGALLHDTVEDSPITLNQIEEQFGARIAHLVDGVTKVARIRASTKHHDSTAPDANADSLHKMMLAMAEDVRVLIIKLADRLHNMRTIDALKPDKRERIAQETLAIYAPLAARIGMHDMREEFEDLAFEVLNPKARKAIIRRFISLKRRSGHMTPKIATEISDLLKQNNISAEVIGRDKRPYSIWHKLETKGALFGQLSDISAFRILVGQTTDCYLALGILHTEWPLIPGRFKDYISVPKPNGYQSLHTTVLGPHALRMEIQIRTTEMDDRAEAGIAAHWLYKSGGGEVKDDPLLGLREWIHSAGESTTPTESIEFASTEDYSKFVYCFTPKGKIIHLPRGANAIDFAYAVHSDVGGECVGAKINGKYAPLFQQLKSGQEVEILRSSGARPQVEWINDVVTSRAKKGIRAAIRAHEEHERATFGQFLGKSAFRAAGLEPTNRAFALAARLMGYPSVEKLYAALGRSKITGKQIVEVIYPERLEYEENLHTTPTTAPRHTIAGIRGKNKVTIAACCNPLPGERIVGVSSTKKGGDTLIHAIDCEFLATPESDKANWADLQWDVMANAHPQNRARIEVIVANRVRSLGKVCDLIGLHGANIEDIEMMQRRPDYFRIEFEITVNDIKHLNKILTSINTESVVSDAKRLRNTSEKPEKETDHDAL